MEVRQRLALHRPTTLVRFSRRCFRFSRARPFFFFSLADRAFVVGESGSGKEVRRRHSCFVGVVDEARSKWASDRGGGGGRGAAGRVISQVLDNTAQLLARLFEHGAVDVARLVSERYGRADETRVRRLRGADEGYNDS
jgi:hypothetical protein